MSTKFDAIAKYLVLAMFGVILVTLTLYFARAANLIPTSVDPPTSGALVAGSQTQPDQTDASLVTTKSASTGSALVAKSLIAYADELSDNWQDWSWNADVNFAAKNPVQDSNAHAIAVTFNEAWSALYLHTDKSITKIDYDRLRFAVHGGGQGNQEIRVLLADANNALQQESVAVTAQADVWTLVEINLAELGSTPQVSGIVWQDAKGTAQPTFYIDQIELVDLDLPPTPVPVPVAGPALTIDASALGHTISPDIYGINYADEALAETINLPVRRWGGNGTTRYNWKLDTANHTINWFFENIAKENPNRDELPASSQANQFIEQNLRTNTETIMTMPMIGWTPKSAERACGFSVAKYGPQQQTDPWQPDCGNGIDLNGNPIVNDPADTSTPIGPEFVEEWMAYLVARYGTAAEGGVAFYNLDNEPMLWHETHRDVHPEPVSYDELLERTLTYASVIKKADPTAQTLGPALWGWWAYFHSALDEHSNSWANKHPDRAAHNDLPLVAWYLQQMAAHEAENGTRLLDYLDLHYYPQAAGVTLAPVGDATTQARRLRSTRSLWDETYIDESWIGEPVQLIPRMRQWVDEYYPGTKLAMTEYNWGGLEDINGAVAQADVLGIFGREGLDLATLWDAPEAHKPFAYAFQMYRNYDGAGSKFGDVSMAAASTDQEQLAIYAALRSQDKAITMMVLNKTTESLTSDITVQGTSLVTEAQAYRYSAHNLNQIEQLPQQTLTDGGFQATLPAMSITLFVIPASDGDSTPLANLN